MLFILVSFNLFDSLFSGVVLLGVVLLVYVGAALPSKGSRLFPNLQTGSHVCSTEHINKTHLYLLPCAFSAEEMSLQQLCCITSTSIITVLEDSCYRVWLVQCTRILDHTVDVMRSLKL